MSDIAFHRTVMGRHFFERQMPELLKLLARLVSELERLNANVERQGTDEGSSGR